MPPCEVSIGANVVDVAALGGRLRAVSASVSSWIAVNHVVLCRSPHMHMGARCQERDSFLNIFYDEQMDTLLSPFLQPDMWTEDGLLVHEADKDKAEEDAAKQALAEAKTKNREGAGLEAHRDALHSLAAVAAKRRERKACWYGSARACENGGKRAPCCSRVGRADSCACELVPKRNTNDVHWQGLCAQARSRAAVF